MASKNILLCYYLSCVLASFLEIISKRRNKRESHTTLQTDYFISNVRRWQFFDFDTLVYYRVVLTTKWWKPPKNATFHTFDGCKKFLVGCLTSCRRSEWRPKNPWKKWFGSKIFQRFAKSRTSNTWNMKIWEFYENLREDPKSRFDRIFFRKMAKNCRFEIFWELDFY